MIDIHSHLLPSIDDGSRSVEQSVRVLNLFRDVGVTDVALTPHVTAFEAATDIDDPLERRELALTLLRGKWESPPVLHLGFEIMLNDELPDKAMRDNLLGLARSRYFLVEFFPMVGLDQAGQLLRGIVEGGVTPVVAHPERYRVCSVEVVSQWRELGARCQVDATTLTRATGRGYRARQLLGAGLIDVMAADNHGDRRVIATGFEFLASRGAGEQAELLASANPSAILQDQPMCSVPPVVLKESLLDRLKRRVRG